jgi:lysophospholipase L1-like esterase
MREISRDPKTPSSVDVRASAREPVTDPTLGIRVMQVVPNAPAKQRLVTIGDSLTQGFQSGAVFNTELSYPRLIAKELGWADEFRFPRYPGAGGLPLNIEFIVRRLEQTFGDRIDWWKAPAAALKLRSVMDEIEDYWERGPGKTPPPNPAIHHNLGIYAWDLRDVLSRTAGRCAAEIGTPHDDLLLQVVESANARAALRVLPPVGRGGPGGMGVLDAAEALGGDGEIETLIVMLGANNALGTVVELKVVWSREGYDDLEQKSAFTVWDPVHFEKELKLLAARVRTIRARHVIWCTVPHVTIAPVARGVGNKIAAESRYFPFYTRPWIEDRDFKHDDDPHITAAEARAIDAAIDQYNDAIVAVVKDARSDRSDPRDWYVFELAGLLDRLAQRRYIDSPAARPAWWTPYALPAALQALSPVPNSRFFASGPTGRTSGGLFSLDGVHPTTAAYGILAQELIRVMELAGVPFLTPDGNLRPSPVNIDFSALLAEDSLLREPPRSFTNDLGLLGWLQRAADVVGLGRVAP